MNFDPVKSILNYAFLLDLEVTQFLTDEGYTRSRTNHNVGVRVTYLKCSVAGCPKRLRLLRNLTSGGDRPPNEIEEVIDTAHNHQAVINRGRGLSVAQKSIVDLCIERGQAAPKKVKMLELTTKVFS